MIILLVSTILSTILPSIISDFDVEKIRLKNGATIIYSATDWGQSSRVISVFFKNGSTLKFEKKTGLPALTQQILSARMKKLARELGFRYSSYLTWDYLAYVLYLPPDMKNEKVLKIWAALYDDSEIESSDLIAAKRNIISSMKYDFEHKTNVFSLISFMTRHNTAYSIGKYGNQEDVESITSSEFSDFKHCYVNPSNSVIVSAPEVNVDKLTKATESFKPCFRDDRFENEEAPSLTVPGRTVTYVKTEKKNLVVRLGFPSVSCQKKENVIYDIIAELLEQDEVISSMSSRVKVENQCYLNNGVFEISLTDVKKDADEVTTKLIQRIAFLSSDLEAASLSLAKTELDKKFWDSINNKDSFVYLVAKAQVLSGNYENFINYTKIIEAIKQQEVKVMLKNMSEKNIYKMYIKQE